MAEKGVLHAVHDDDLATYLESLGILSDLKAGRLGCKFCGEGVTLNSLQALFPESGMIHVVCSKADCMKKLMLYVAER